MHWYDKQVWWNISLWKMGNPHDAILFSVGVFCVVLFIATNIGVLRPSKRFRAKHKILCMPAGKAIGNCIEFILDWIFIPILDKFVFIFTPLVYKKKVITGVEDRVHNLYKSKVNDYEYQIKILTDDRNSWRTACQNKENSMDQMFWDGAKRGYNLSERRKQKDKSKEPEVLTSSHLFVLKEVVSGNKTVNGLAASYLEDHGYIRAVPEKNGETYYESTMKGLDYLNQYAKDILKKLDA